MYEIMLTKDAQKFYEHAEDNIVRKINRCFNQLKNNPYEHPNIKSLKGPLKGNFRYRIGSYRVVYKINEEKKEIIILVIIHRSKGY